MPLIELYDLNADPEEKKNIAGDRPVLIEDFMKLISSIAPEKSRVTQKMSNPNNITKDKKLMDTLRSLGYIK